MHADGIDWQSPASAHPSSPLAAGQVQLSWSAERLSTATPSSSTMAAGFRRFTPHLSTIAVHRRSTASRLAPTSAQRAQPDCRPACGAHFDVRRDGVAVDPLAGTNDGHEPAARQQERRRELAPSSLRHRSPRYSPATLAGRFTGLRMNAGTLSAKPDRCRLPLALAVARRSGRGLGARGCRFAAAPSDA